MRRHRKATMIAGLKRKPFCGCTLLVTFGFMVIFHMAACGPREASEELWISRDLLGLVEHAETWSKVPDSGEVPLGLYINVGHFEVAGEHKPALFLHPESEVRFSLELGAHPELTFMLGMKPAAWDKSVDGVVFKIIVEGKNGAQEIFYKHFDPRRDMTQRGWVREHVDLSAHAGQTVTLRFRSEEGPDGNAEYDWFLVGEPVLEQFETVKRRPRDEKPSLLLVSVDTLRADALASYGNPTAYTPTTDRLARSGYLFKDCYATFNATRPSLASMMTGLYGSGHGVFANPDRFSDENQTLSEILGQAGYITAASVGANHIGHEGSGFRQGFSRFESSDHGPERSAEEVNKDAKRFLLDHYSDPFFLWTHYFDPHTLYEPLGFYANLSSSQEANEDKLSPSDKPWNQTGAFVPPHVHEWAEELPSVRSPNFDYSAEVAYTEEAIGNILRFLDQRGVLDQTLVIFTADHGESLGQHQIYFDHAGLYEQSLRVPLLIRPHQTRAGAGLIMSPARGVDLLSTALELLGAPPATETDGSSLAPLLDEPGRRWAGDSAPSAAHRLISEHSARKAVAVHDGRYKAILALQGLRFHSEFVLYDLQADPAELIDLTRELPERAGELRAVLESWAERSRERDTNPLTDQKTLEDLRALGYIQ